MSSALGFVSRMWLGEEARILANDCAGTTFVDRRLKVPCGTGGFSGQIEVGYFPYSAHDDCREPWVFGRNLKQRYPVDPVSKTIQH